VHLAETARATEPPKSPAVPAFFIVQPHPLRRTFWLLRQALVAAYQDNCFSIAKGAAYSFLLSLFPVLTTLTSVLIQIKAQAVVRVIATFLSQVAPPGTEEIIVSRLRRGDRPITLPVVAVLLSLWAGSGAIMSLMEGFQAAYRIPSGRPFLKQRSMAIFLLVISALPFVTASLLILFGDRTERSLVRALSGLPVAELSIPVQLGWRLARYLVAFGTTTFVTGLLYYFGPNHRPAIDLAGTQPAGRFRRVWPGAFLATTLWLAATLGFAWYVRRIANYNFFYGSIGAVIILLIWLYLIACIFLIGCEFNAERERIDTLPFTH
jgi:membrane protein